MTDKIRIVQVRSAIGRKAEQKRILRALGIRKLNQAVIHDDTPYIRGMINKTSHLLEVTKAD